MYVYTHKLIPGSLVPLLCADHGLQLCSEVPEISHHLLLVVQLLLSDEQLVQLQRFLAAPRELLEADLQLAVEVCLLVTRDVQEHLGDVERTLDRERERERVV